VSSAEDTAAAEPEITLRDSRTKADLDSIEPLWNALQEHHARITPSLGPRLPRELDDAWRVRRSKYEHWLEDPETFCLIAAVNGQVAGYAFVTIGPGYASWATGERAAVLETLSVLPDHRGGGIGTALLEAVWSRLEQEGIDDMAITTTVTNVDSHRFYERHGFEQGFTVYHGTRRRT
jgi:ribosomal protein S18 acetylase RimI-like enzyme